MFVTLPGENYTANLYSFLVIYTPQVMKTIHKKLRGSFNLFSNSARWLEVPLRIYKGSRGGGAIF